RDGGEEVRVEAGGDVARGREREVDDEIDGDDDPDHGREEERDQQPGPRPRRFLRLEEVHGRSGSAGAPGYEKETRGASRSLSSSTTKRGASSKLKTLAITFVGNDSRAVLYCMTASL